MIEKGSKLTYDEFMIQYENDHALCPKCGSYAHGSTLVGFSLDLSKPEEYEDLNRCTCTKCGDIHRTHDRKPLAEGESN